MIAPFGERLSIAVERVGAPVAVGLDPHLQLYPEVLRRTFEGRTGAEGRAAAAAATPPRSLTIIGCWLLKADAKASL